MTTNTPLSRSENAVTVRLAGPDDAALVHRMVCEIAEHENSLDAVEADRDRWREMLARPDVQVLLLMLAGEPAGYVSATRRLQLWLGRDILALDDLYVRPGFRNRGLGEQLMTSLAEVAARDRLLLRWEMLEDNLDAQRFYRRLGASLRTKVIATWSPQDYEAALESAQVDSRKLNPGPARPAPPVR
jgi:ribosomal protein S18 acetylase RimI-like enzyme